MTRRHNEKTKGSDHSLPFTFVLIATDLID